MDSAYISLITSYIFERISIVSLYAAARIQPAPPRAAYNGSAAIRQRGMQNNGSAAIRQRGAQNSVSAAIRQRSAHHNHSICSFLCSSRMRTTVPLPGEDSAVI